MPAVHLPEEAAEYKNEWVAFSIDLKRVVGHGLTTTEAVQMAEDAGEPHAFLLFIPDRWPDALVL